MDYLLNDDESDNNLARKIFIFSNPGIFLLSCPPPCGHFLIQQSTAGGLSYKTFMPRILGTTINETYMGHDWVFSCLP